MVIVMRPDATAGQVEAVVATVNELGFRAHVVPGRGRTAVAVVGNPGPLDPARFSRIPGVARTFPITTPYRLVARETLGTSTRVALAIGAVFGAGNLVVLAGPCAVEDAEQYLATAAAVARAGASVLRGGVFKPRTSPYSFQGLGLEALPILAQARALTGLAIVTEVLEPASVEPVAAVADMLQIGARNMQNAPLLRAAARAGKPILLKRGPAATIEEFLLAAEYLVAEGNPDVVLCERGVRGFDPATRYLFDVTAIPLLHQLTHLPVIADPSHATGHHTLVPSVARAAVAAGADGLLLEVHADPHRARSDGLQSLSHPEFETLMHSLPPVCAAIGHPMAVPSVAHA